MGEAYLRGKIIGALGGRMAEQLVFGETTTGAETDLEQASAIARQMVGRWGMSTAVGPMTVIPGLGEEVPLFGVDPSGHSEATRELVDSEARSIIDECAERALAMLSEHRAQLDQLASTLLERETLDEADAYTAAGVPHDQLAQVGPTTGS
jgi:cell division protease FtsH